MKKLLKMLLILFSIYLLIQIAFKFWGNGHEVSYQIKIDDKTFDIKEVYKSNTEDEIDSYYFNISYNNNKFSFQTYELFKNAEQVIKNIKYFENDNYKCLLPVFSQDIIIMDIMCLKDGNIIYYHNIKGNDVELDNFANTLNISKYDLEKWTNDKTNPNKQGVITIYPKNVLDNHYIGINNYKGINILNNNNKNLISQIGLFSNDVYKRDLEVMISHFYVVADYNSNHEFNKFYIVDLISNKKDVISSNKNISFDSYIQGVVKGSIYIYDEVNKKQYEVDIDAKTILEVGNSSTKILNYSNGSFDRVDISELSNKKLIFTNGETTTSDSKYARIDTIVQGETGYKYYYEQVSGGYDVYRAPNRTPELKTYLFKIKKLDNIKYVYDFVYFVDGDEVKYYNDSYGLKTLFKNEEFDFNESLKYTVYIKR
ncbi:MAG: hypothetical protein PHX03_00220 [Bacilli bacterium]|nr:hypothetical protein [Bacilli bacterium]MDD4718205.1 hypothetical protein [Bacilli bacterium]